MVAERLHIYVLEGANHFHFSNSKAKVLLVTVDGTPMNDDMNKAVLERSHSVIRFIEPIEYPESATKSEITDDLRTRLAQATGWSLVN